MSNRMILAILVAAVFGLPARNARAQEKCDSAADMVVQAREQARPDLTREEAGRVTGKLKSATSLCSASGDAWYYRYLYAQRLGDRKDAEYALTQARMFNAEGLRRGDNPFAPVVTAGAASVARLSPIVREKWALVVGIGEFQYPGINPLKYTAKDARDFAALLTDPAHGRFKKTNVTLLTNAEATTTRIKSELEHLSESARADDLVVIYISTHGSPREMHATEVNYIVTYDTNPKRIYTTSLPMVDVIRDAKKMIRAERVAVFLDTCYSGAATLAGVVLGEGVARSSGHSGGNSGGNSSANSGNGAEGTKAMGFVGGVSRDLLSRAGTGAGHVIISASQPDERSWESNELKNGIFTYYQIESLKQNNGMTLIGEVFLSLRDRVSQRARTEKKTNQRPMMEPPETKADIRIGVPPQPR